MATDTHELARIDQNFFTPVVDESPSPFLPNTNIQFAWDSTSLGLIKTCARLYQYTMIEGWQSRDENVHLRFGGEYHSALEHFDHLTAEGHDREDAIQQMVRGILDRTADWAPDEDTKAGKYKNRATLLQLVIDYLDHFSPDPAATYIKADGTPAVELSFRFELDWGPTAANWASIGPNEYQTISSPEPQPYLLCGHLDRVVTFNSTLFVMDRKTSTATLSAHYFAQYNPHNQMSLYTYAGKIMMSAPIRGVIIDAAQIKLEEPNAFARGFSYRTEAQLDEWMVDLRTTLQLAEIYATNNYWPQNDTSCDRFGGCKFRSICSKDPHVRPNFLKTEFTQLPPDQIWNPLRSRG